MTDLVVIVYLQIAKKRRIITCSIPVVQTAMTKDPWDNIDNIEVLKFYITSVMFSYHAIEH